MQGRVVGGRSEEAILTKLQALDFIPFGKEDTEEMEKTEEIGWRRQDLKNPEKTHNFSAPHLDAAAYESWVKTET